MLVAVETAPSGNKRVLVMVPNWLGDCIMAWPVLDALKAASYSVVVAARHELMPLFHGVETDTEVIEAPRGGIRGLFETTRFAQVMKQQSPDLVLLLPNSYSSAFHTWFARIPERAGVDFRPGRKLFLTKVIAKERYMSFPHQTQRYLCLLDAIGLGTHCDKDRLPVVRLKPSSTALELASALQLPAKYAVMAPEAAYGPAKEWPLDRFGEVVRKLARDGWAVAVTGKPVHEARFARLTSLGSVVNLMGRTDLTGLTGVLAGAGLFVGNDSGAAHLAAALGVPTVVIFGSTSPEATRPLGEKVKVVSGKTECSPCFKRTCRYNTYECLNRITVEAVLEAVGEVLGE
jgi:heptosyltransferase-2